MIRVLLITLLWFTTTPTAHAQRGRGPVLDAQRLASAFRQRAWTIQEGKIRIVSDIDPDTRGETFAKTRWLFSTIELVFDGMRTRRPSDGVEVFYAGDRNDYLSLIAVEAKADGSNTAGMAAYGGRRTMLFVKGLAWRTIQHEAWHASRSVFIPDMPTWLDEGVAEVFEHGTFLEDQFVIGGVGADDLARVRALFETDTWVPLGRFIRTDDGWNRRVREGSVQGIAQYVQAWAICHFLLFADDGEHRARLNTFLRAMNAGRDEWQAFDAAIGANDQSVAALDREVRKFFETARPVDPGRTYTMLLEWAEEVATTFPDRGRIDLAPIASSLVEHLADEEHGPHRREIEDDAVSMKAGRGGRGPVVSLGPIDGLGWSITWTRNDRRRRPDRDRADAGEEPAWIPSVRWSLGG